jgi:hypothetical protein
MSPPSARGASIDKKLQEIRSRLAAPGTFGIVCMVRHFTVHESNFWLSGQQDKPKAASVGRNTDASHCLRKAIDPLRPAAPDGGTADR